MIEAWHVTSRLPIPYLCSFSYFGNWGWSWLCFCSWTGNSTKNCKIWRNRQQSHFHPLKVTGVWCSDAVEFIYEYGQGNRISDATSDKRESMFLFQRLSIKLQKNNADCVVGAVLPSLAPLNMLLYGAVYFVYLVYYFLRWFHSSLYMWSCLVQGLKIIMLFNSLMTNTHMLLNDFFFDALINDVRASIRVAHTLQSKVPIQCHVMRNMVFMPALYVGYSYMLGSGTTIQRNQQTAQIAARVYNHRSNFFSHGRFVFVYEYTFKKIVCIFFVYIVLQCIFGVLYKYLLSK